MDDIVKHAVKIAQALERYNNLEMQLDDIESLRVKDNSLRTEIYQHGDITDLKLVITNKMCKFKPELEALVIEGGKFAKQGEKIK